MTSDAHNNNPNKAFTLVEAIMTIAILSITMVTMAIMIQFSDNSAMQANLSSLAMLTFGQQAAYVTQVPMSAFKAGLDDIGCGTNSTIATNIVNKNDQVFAKNVLAAVTQDPTLPNQSLFLTKDSGEWSIPYTNSLSVTASGGENIDSATNLTVTISLNYQAPNLLSTNPIPRRLTFTFLKQ